MSRESVTKIRSVRLSRGWTQIELAQRAGLSQNDISRFENGARPTDPKIDALAAAFGVRPWTVYRWLREPAEETAA